MTKIYDFTNENWRTEWLTDTMPLCYQIAAINSVSFINSGMAEERIIIVPIEHFKHSINEYFDISDFQIMCLSDNGFCEYAIFNEYENILIFADEKHATPIVNEYFSGTVPWIEENMDDGGNLTEKVYEHIGEGLSLFKYMDLSHRTTLNP